MTLDDFVANSIACYPSLYLCDTYDESKLKALHHAFIVLGNGFEWANTKDPTKGGYLTGDSYYKRNGDWVRKIDPPYGRVKFKGDINRYFTHQLYDVGIAHSMLGRNDDYYKDLAKLEKIPPFEGMHVNRNLYLFAEKVAPAIAYYKEHGLELVSKPFRSHQYPFKPYPSFSKQYSCFWEDEAKYIQHDWRVAAIEHLVICKSYFEAGNHKLNPDKFHDSYTSDEYVDRCLRFIDKTILKLQ